MTVQVQRHIGRVLVINDEPFFLAVDAEGRPAWQPTEVPTQDGDPTTPRRWSWRDWSRGMGDSRGAYRGSVEYAENAWLGKRGRILPGPKPTSIADVVDGDIVSIVEVTSPASRIIAFGGTQAAEINPATFASVATTANLGATVSGRCVLFGDNVAIPLGTSTDFKKRNSAGTYAANSISYKASCFGLSGPDLVRGRANTWSKCSDADFYSATGNWTSEYNIGRRETTVTEVFEAARWDYVLKPEGLFTFEAEHSDDVNVLPDLGVFASTENRFWFPWDSKVMVCALGGLYRYITQGAGRTVGIEEAPYNEGELSSCYPTAGVSFGSWAYVALNKSGVTYLCALRRAEDGDASGTSPYTFVSVVDKFTGNCRAMYGATLSDAPRLYYAVGNDIRRFDVTRDGAPSTYRDSGTLDVYFAPSDLGAPMTVKYGRSIELYGRNLASGRGVQWKANWDAAGWNNVGSELTSLSGGRAEAFFTKGTNDNGRVLQLRPYTGLNSSSTAPEIRDVVLNYEERPAMVPAFAAAIALRDYGQHGGFSSRITAKEQKDLLSGYFDGTIVTITDAYGDSYAAAIAPLDGATDWQFSGELPQGTLPVTIRKLDYA